MKNGAHIDYYDAEKTEVSCLDPILIVNPSAREIALQSQAYFVDGVRHNIDGDLHWRLLQNLDTVSKILKLPYVESFSDEFRKKHSDKDLKECEKRLSRFISDSFFLLESGECKPIYIWVPCGHCDCCLSRKLTSYLQRAQMALLESKRPALFVTLQYNDWHLPKDGVCFKHIQNFKKRFKRLIEHLFDSECARNIKFLVVSEYGSKVHTQRPHYHCLIFGVPKFSDNSCENDFMQHYAVYYCWREPERVDVSGLVRYMSFEQYKKTYSLVYNRPAYYDNYSFGYANVVECDGNTRVVSYVCKYMSKGSNVPYGKLPNFKSVSQNLGLNFVKENFVVGQSFKFCDIDGKCKESNLCGYYLKKLLPSVSDMIPSDVRKSYFDLFYFYDRIKSSNYPYLFKKYAYACCCVLRDLVSPLFGVILPDWDGVPFHEVRSEDYLYIDSRGSRIAYCYDDSLLEAFHVAFNVVYDFFVSFDFEQLFNKIRDRDLHFKDFKSRSKGQLRDSATRYRRDIIKNLSNVKL